MFLAKKSNKSSISTKGIKALLTSVLASTISPFAFKLIILSSTASVVTSYNEITYSIKFSFITHECPLYVDLINPYFMPLSTLFWLS